jgi:SAM-dependent methyltransferase
MSASPLSPILQRPTFRDPAGSLSLTPEFAVRTIQPGSRAAVLAFLASPFYQQAVARGEMSSTTIESSGPDADPASPLVLRHPRIAIPSYPWEWTPAQWLAAAELTLSLGERGNILFEGPTPILVDVLSFDPLEPGNATWLAYGQYMRTFLLPLLAHRLLAWPLELTQLRRDGYEPTEIAAALGPLRKLSPSAFWPVTLPAWLEKRQSDKPASSTPPQKKIDPGAAAHVLTRNLQSLAKRTRSAAGSSATSQWSEYTGTLTHYTPEQAEAKRQWVEATLRSAAPARVLDIGANTGDFSALAATIGAQVIALERDAPAADRIHQRSVAQNLSIQTIHADLARPTPAVGWENAESMSLLARLEGRFDMVMMLAVIHHLILMEQIPIPAILDLVARLTTRFVILEWVPVEDPMFQSLMRGRTSLYGHLHERDLLATAEGRFRVAAEHRLANGRVLFLFETISA